MLKHFVITRLGLCIYNPDRLKTVIDLFESITFPSLSNQSTDAFIWLVVTDSRMPPAARERLTRLLSAQPHFHIVSVDVTALTHVRHGCFDWIWDCCQDYILHEGLLGDATDYVITSLIDADDAWRRDTVLLVNRFMEERLPAVRQGEEERGTWLRHTAGIVGTFPRGLKWFVGPDLWDRVAFPFMSMAVFVAARFSSGVSACSSRHRGWPAYSDVLAFTLAEMDDSREMWIYTRHDLATQRWDASDALSLSAAERAQLDLDFGIDTAGVRHLCETHRLSSGTAPLAHPGRDASAQYDRVFRIAALNRKIQALRSREDAEEEQSEDTKRPASLQIEEAADRRAELVRMLLTSGAS